jgi:hypothetical protein
MAASPGMRTILLSRLIDCEELGLNKTSFSLVGKVAALTLTARVF